MAWDCQCPPQPARRETDLESLLLAVPTHRTRRPLHRWRQPPRRLANPWVGGGLQGSSHLLPAALPSRPCLLLHGASRGGGVLTAPATGRLAGLQWLLG